MKNQLLRQLAQLAQLANQPTSQPTGHRYDTDTCCAWNWHPAKRFIASSLPDTPPIAIRHAWRLWSAVSRKRRAERETMTDIQTPPNGKDDDNPSTSGRFNYLDSSVAGSLYRNGAVLVRRDADGSDNGFQGLVLQEQSMTVHDARAGDAKERPTLLANGFELLARPLGRPESGELDFFNHRDVTQTYYSECADIIQEATGAAFVAAFDHNVRSAVGKRGKRRIQGGQQVQGPAHMAHGDYTLTSGPDRLRQLAADPSINDTLSSVLGPGETLLEAQRVARATDENGRFAIINLWRSIAKEPVATHPIALCDAQTVKPEDLVVFELHYQDRIGENYFAKHASRH
ncbi:MAG: hypothetical protein ACI91F_002016, partial [Candidatus Binatia bacterium]